MKNTLETRLGMFFAVAIIAAVVIIEVIGGTGFLKGGYRVHGYFNNVQDLKAGDPVKMAGFPIGRVEKIGLADGKVKVTMKIDRGVDIHTDSKAAVRFTGLLGQNFVAVDFGSPNAPKLEDDQNITTSETTDFGALMAKLEGVASGVEGMTKNFSGDAFQNLLGPFTDFIKENNPRITAILGNLQNISTVMAEGKGTVGKLINDPALYNSALSAVSNLNGTASDIQKLMGDAQGVIGSARTVMEGVQKGEGTLGKLTKDEALYKETTTAMTNLREILEKINQGQGSVGKLVNDESLFKNVKMTLQKVEKATEGLEDQGPLSVLGILVNNLF
jgi:phospholipid/cholesterol/gamma-HCH transport system substrate-binding protein